MGTLDVGLGHLNNKLLPVIKPWPVHRTSFHGLKSYSPLINPFRNLQFPHMHQLCGTQEHKTRHTAD